MDDDTSNFGLSTSSKSYKSALLSRSDLYIDFEEIEGDDDFEAEISCPFCSEEFDPVGLCCHIDDEHPIEAKSEICPLCAARVGMNMVGHITTQHGSIFKIQQKRKPLKGELHSTLSLLRKELEDGYLQSLLGGVVSSSNMAPDPLLLSFIYNLPMADESESIQPSSSTEVSLEEKCSDENVLERNVQPSPLSDKDQEEKAQRCEFVQGLLMSTFLDDSL